MAGYGLTKPDHLSEALKFELKNLNIESEIINGSVSGEYRDWETDRKSTRLNSSHSAKSRMPSSA